nr:MAG TPA: protein of unknown function (UPF0370) [Bacteriophage sp.]
MFYLTIYFILLFLISYFLNFILDLKKEPKKRFTYYPFRGNK